MRSTINYSRRCKRPSRTAFAAGLALCIATLFLARPAAAQEFTLHVEPAVAFFVDTPQLDRFTPAFYFAIRPGVSLGRVLAVQWSYALLATAADKGYEKNGSGHFLSAGLRLKPFATLRPATEQLGGFFIDFNMGYVRTGYKDRFGFDAGMGYGFQISRWFSLGLVVRYGQIVQPDDIKNQDPNDAQFITVGLDLAFGPAYEKKYEHECPDPPECKQEQVQKAEVEVAAMALLPCSCPDSDWDGVCDAVDRCPTEIGPPATLGCPIDPCSGEALVVLVQFEFDSASMPPSKIGKQQTMDPVLDAVAEAISKDPSCRVCIMGHASEEGPVEHNNELSLWRADAVQSYLIAHGLDQSLMPTIGKGVSCPLVPETSLSLNRRVEFIRLDEGETCPLDCSY